MHKFGSKHDSVQELIATEDVAPSLFRHTMSALLPHNSPVPYRCGHWFSLHHQYARVHVQKNARFEERVAEVASFNSENVWRKRGISITPIR